MTKTNPTGLRVPEQKTPSGSPVFLDDKKLASWAKELPVANIGETARKLFETLRSFNRTRMASTQRIRSVEQLRESLGYVSDSLNKHYLNVRFPLSEKAQKIANLNRELHSGMATAYKAAIIDLLMENKGVVDQTQLSLAIHRCLGYLSQVILLSVVVYDVYPKRTWQELHILHRLATRYNLGTVTVDNKLEANTKRSSIDEMYRRCLLFSLSSPYKMRQKENILLFSALLEWSRHTRIFPYDEAPDDNTITIHQDTDLAPSHEERVDQVDSKYLLILDASPLLSNLRDLFVETSDSSLALSGVEQLNKNLIRQLIMLWSKAQKRAFVRTKLNFELRIAVGIRSIHKLIMLGDEPTPPDDKSADDGTWIETQFSRKNDLKVSEHFSLMPMDIASYNPRRGDFEEFGPNSTDFSGFESPKDSEIKIWEDEPKKPLDSTTNLFHTINESAGGYCLDWRGKKIPKIQVGELIGVQSAISPSQFGVGIVRWMRSSDDDSMKVGIQMIAPNALAITAIESGQMSSTKQECLLLPEVGTSGQPTSFICSSHTFELGKVLLVNDGENNKHIKLTRILESNGSISQFQFVYLDDTRTSSDEGGDSGDSDADFDSLWSTLT
jgi:hypothetical protein